MTDRKRQPPIPWEPADKARALVLLRENQGALRATARQWNALGGRRLTEATLRLWRDDPSLQLATLVVDAKRDRIETLDSIVRKLTQGYDKVLDEQPGIVSHLARKQPAALTTAIGTLIDKIRLLKGEATEITEQRTLSGFLATAKWIEPDEKERADVRPN